MKRYWHVTFEENGGEYGTAMVVYAARVKKLSKNRLQVDDAVIRMSDANAIGTVERATKAAIWWSE